MQRQVLNLPRSMDDILRSVLVEDGVSELRFRRISEDQKRAMSATLVNQVFKTVKEKSLNIDYSGVEESKGDVEKAKGYEDLEGSIAFLMSMHSSQPDAPAEIPQLNLCLQNLIRYKKDFEMGFQRKEEMTEFLYNNMVFSLVNATCFLIATTIEYVRDPMNMYKPVFKRNVERSAESTLYFGNIAKFNAYAEGGKLSEFFRTVRGVQNFTGILVGAITVIAAVALFVWLLRELVYQLYWTRNRVAHQLKYLAVFLQMNAATLDKDKKAAKEKQEALSKTLVDWADKITVEQKISAKKASSEIHREDSDTTEETLDPDNNLL